MKTINSKILLFGEYSVLNGSKALAIPYGTFNGKLDFDINFQRNESHAESNKVFKYLFEYIKNNKFIARFNQLSFSEDLNKGLYFNSNIPVGYGLGSSGAVVAALYHEYFTDKPTKLELIKQDLANIESYFHGSSSGTDPLVSYFNKSILINPDKIIDDFSPNADIVCFLINSKQARKTDELIKLYHKKNIQNPSLSEEINKQTNITIEAYINHSPYSYSEIQHLCILQNHFLSDFLVLPETLQNYKTLFGEMLSLKLCGAGGGGYVLGFTNILYWNDVKKKLKTLKVEPELISQHN